MRLTKKKAIELSIEKWTDHALTGESNPEVDWHERHGYPVIESDCALCEYQERHDQRDKDCNHCSYFLSFGYCTDDNSPYDNWSSARTPEERKKYASEFLEQLRELL